jgi:hypothetical protein
MEEGTFDFAFFLERRSKDDDVARLRYRSENRFAIGSDCRLVRLIQRGELLHDLASRRIEFIDTEVVVAERNNGVVLGRNHGCSE